MQKDLISIAIADDHPMLIKGLIDYINLFEFFNIVIEASNGKELIDKIQKSETLPDICILDINMPEMNGYETLKQIKKNWYSVKVLIYSMIYNDFSIAELLSNGANGILKKTSNPRQLQSALASVYYNDFYLAESLNYRKNPMRPKITDREMEFLQHCVSELNYKEIAEKMNIGVRTIETYRDSLFTKLEIKSRTGLALFALKNGIVSIAN